MLSRRLTRAGYEVTLAEDGPAALDLIRPTGAPAPSPEGPDGAPPPGSFDLVLLDVMMPGIDGFEVLRQVRQRCSPTDLPVIMATAKDHREDIVQALNLGANDYVTKPLDFPVVLARVQTQLAVKRSVDQVLRLERSLERRNAELARANQRITRELELAAKVQRSLLPADLPAVPGVRFAWSYRPCDELAGDILNIFRIGPGRTAMYLLDVSGHGVPAALLSVTLSRLLTPWAGGGSLLVGRGRDGEGEPVPPALVAAELNRRFLMDVETLQYFTLFYGVLETEGAGPTGGGARLRYVCAGHPPPVLVPAGGAARVVPFVAEGDERPAGGGGFPIGWFADATYAEHTVDLSPGDRLYLHSDGVSEAMDAARAQFGTAGVLRAVEATRGEPIDRSLEALLEAAARWSREGRFADDVSAIAVEAVGTGRR